LIPVTRTQQANRHREPKGTNMTGTANQTSKGTTTTTTATPKARPVKRAALNAHAMKALGILVVTETSMVEDWNAAQDLRARVAFDAYALSQGWAGKAKTGVEIAKMLGTSKGNVSALTRAGAILNRAGAGAQGIGSKAVTVCQNMNAGQTAHLDALTAGALVKAVEKTYAAALAGKATSQGRSASTAGKGKGTTGKGKAGTTGATVPVETTDAGRATSALGSLRAIKSEGLATVDAPTRKALGLAMKSLTVEVARITAALAVEDKTGQPVA
jgi:hypothetical protein